MIYGEAVSSLFCFGSFFLFFFLQTYGMNLRKELCLFCADPVFSYEEVLDARRGCFVVRSCSKVKFEELLTFAARILKRLRVFVQREMI